MVRVRPRIRFRIGIRVRVRFRVGVRCLDGVLHGRRLRMVHLPEPMVRVRA